MKFTKMHGTGNDYIFVDCFDISVEDMSGLAVRMSDRHFGAGGDGAVFLYPSFVADVRMRMFNADGSEGAMCGNAVRCIARLIRERTGKTECSIETNSGIKSVAFVHDDIYTVDMGEPEIGELDKSIFVCGRQLRYTYVSMGNPHCVIFGEPDMTLARSLMDHSFFPGGINVEIAVPLSKKALKVYVWERGSGETLACGTGACAAVAAGVKLGKVLRNEDIEVRLKGGTLIVNYGKNIYLSGNAVKVYEGEYYDKVHFCDGRRCQRFG